MVNTIPSAEECAKFLDHLDDHYRCCDLARSPNATPEVLRKMMVTDFRGYTYLVRSAIMDNPNVPDDVVEAIMKDAHSRHEQYAVYRYWARKLNVEFPGADDQTPYEPPLELFGAKPLEPEVRDGMLLDAMPSFSEHMWHELGSRGLLELDYWDDHVDGSIFGPISWAGMSNEYMLRILGKGFFTEWATWEGHIEIDYGLERLADDAEDFKEMGDWAYSLDSDTPFPAVLLGTYLAVGQRDGHLTIQDEDYVQDLMDEAFEGDETAFDFDVTITGEPTWAGPKWSQMTADAKGNFTRNVIAALEHPYLGGWGFAQHMLALIAVHPDTPVSALKTIKNLDLKYVNAALEAAESK